MRSAECATIAASKGIGSSTRARRTRRFPETDRAGCERNVGFSPGDFLETFCRRSSSALQAWSSGRRARSWFWSATAFDTLRARLSCRRQPQPGRPSRPRNWGGPSSRLVAPRRTGPPAPSRRAAPELRADARRRRRHPQAGWGRVWRNEHGRESGHGRCPGDPYSFLARRVCPRGGALASRRRPRWRVPSCCEGPSRVAEKVASFW